jgi:serine/threonine-protein kinase
VFQALASAAWDRGDDPGPLLDEAQAAFQKAIAVAPEQGYGYNNVGEVLVQRAGFQRAQGEDPRASVNDAVAMLNQALSKTPNHPTFRANLAMAYSILADYDLDHGRDPQPSLRSAAAALQPALDKHSTDAGVEIYAAETQGLLVRLEARRGGARTADFQLAAGKFEQALALDPDNEDHALLFGRFCRAWAMFERETGGDPGPALIRGLALVNQVLEHHPRWPDAVVLRASLSLVQARGRDAAGRRASAEQAQQDFDAALTANPSLKRVWAGEAALANQLARP